MELMKAINFPYFCNNKERKGRAVLLPQLIALFLCLDHSLEGLDDLGSVPTSSAIFFVTLEKSFALSLP